MKRKKSKKIQKNTDATTARVNLLAALVMLATVLVQAILTFRDL